MAHGGHSMSNEHVLPEEIRTMINLLVRDGLGQESEGTDPATHAEELLKTGGLKSEYFGEHFPHIKPDLKALIGIKMLYEVVFYKLGLRLSMPNKFTDYDGVTRQMTTKDHLTQLLKLWGIIAKVELIGSPLRID